MVTCSTKNVVGKDDDSQGRAGGWLVGWLAGWWSEEKAVCSRDPNERIFLFGIIYGLS